MALEFKFVPGSTPGILQLIDDVPVGNVAYYDLASFPEGIFHEEYLVRCSHVTVAVSGTPVGRNWMVISPHRVDADRVADSNEGSQKVYDLDPLILFVDSQTSLPGEPALIAYHQDFEGRTSVIPGHALDDLPSTVSQLRSKVLSGVEPIEKAPGEVINALHHMYKVFKDRVGDL